MYSLNSQFANSQTLWIGDLESYMDEDFVRRLFGPDVQPHLHAVKLIKKEGRPAGYGFLDFTSRDAAQQVLTNYSGRPIAQAPGKVYRLNWASGHITGGTGQAAKQLAGNVGGDLYSVFVGDLSPDVTDYILLNSFQQRYPSVRGAKVIMDLNTGQSKGFGFVKFTEEQDMLRAMEEMNGQYVGSRPVKVAPASNSKRGGGAGGGGMGGGSRDASSSSYNSMANMNYNNYNSGNGAVAAQNMMGNYNQMHSHSISPSPMSAGSNRYDNSGSSNADSGNTTIYVGNLDPNTTDENVLRQTFSVYGPITYVKIPSNNRHCGFVQFAERSQAERAVMEMNGSRIQGNIVRVSWGKQQKKPHHHHHQQQQHHHHHQQHQQHHHQQQHQMHMQHQGSGGMAPTTAYSVSPTPTAAAVIPQQQQQQQQQQQTTAQQQQQYMAYLQWQQQMMAYTQMQQQQQQQQQQQLPSGQQQEANDSSTMSTDEDNLPSDYFTKGFDSQQENSKYIETHEPMFTFSSIDLGHYMEDGVA